MILVAGRPGPVVGRGIMVGHLGELLASDAVMPHGVCFLSGREAGSVSYFAYS
jgi:hypothetical protein